MSTTPVDPTAASVDELLEKLADQPAGVASVTLLASVNPAELDAGAKVDYLKALQRATAWIDGLTQHALAAIEVGSGAEPDSPADFDDDWAREQVGAALRLHPITASRRLFIARGLVERFPSALRSLEEGRIGYLHAMLIVDGAVGLRGDLYAAYECRVLAKAERQTVGDTGRTIKKVLAQLDPKDADQVHQQAYADRRVKMWPSDNAMADVQAVLGADGAQIVMTALNGLVDAVLAANPDDPRTTDQIRADMFTGVFDAIRTGGAIPSPYFRRQGEEDSADDDSQDAPRPIGNRKLRRRELLVRPGDDGESGELDGYGAVPASLIDRLLARDKVNVPLEPAAIGDLDFDWGEYRPNSRLARYVRERDRTCTFPGCSRRAALCDLDHIDPWPDGPTSANNLHCLCRRHHRLKTFGDWKVRRDPDGGLTWTAPTGHDYRAPPIE